MTLGNWNGSAKKPCLVTPTSSLACSVQVTISIIIITIKVHQDNGMFGAGGVANEEACDASFFLYKFFSRATVEGLWQWRSEAHAPWLWKEVGPYCVPNLIFSFMIFFHSLEIWSKRNTVFRQHRFRERPKKSYSEVGLIPRLRLDRLTLGVAWGSWLGGGLLSLDFANSVQQLAFGWHHAGKHLQLLPCFSFLCHWCLS